MRIRPVSVELKRDAEKYDIVIGHRHLKDLGSQLAALKIGTTAVVITNPAIRHHHEGQLASGLRDHGFELDVIEVPSGETSKSAEVAFDLIRQIAQRHSAKDVFLIALGGGVVGDLVGFVAASYKRGIPYVQVPTTFLAQIDSAIGGKVAIDLPFGKNLVGAFYHPRLVFTDTAVLSTLDRRQVQAGLAEAIKYGVICDKNFFRMIEERLTEILKLEETLLTEVVYQCSRIKASLVSRDEKESRGLRTILNFGHTVGHAIEAAAGYDRYNHGESIALGMRIAAKISFKQGLVGPESVERLDRILQSAGLPNAIEGISVEKILSCMRYDKKFKSGKTRFVLMTGIGTVKVVDGVPQEHIQGAVQECLRIDGCPGSCCAQGLL